MNGRQRSRVLGAVALVVMTALAATAYATAAPAHSSNFPSQGLVVPGQSIGGITLGMTPAQVIQRWGHNYDTCDDCGKRLVWLYEYRGAEPLGAAVKFDVLAPKADQKPAGSGAPGGAATKNPPPPTTGHVVAVFTLGSPMGWGVKGKVMMFGPVSDVYNVLGNLNTVNCIGYTALTARAGQNTMAFYSASGVIYGFALTGPSESPCQ